MDVDVFSGWLQRRQESVDLLWDSVLEEIITEIMSKGRLGIRTKNAGTGSGLDLSSADCYQKSWTTLTVKTLRRISQRKRGPIGVMLPYVLDDDGSRSVEIADLTTANAPFQTLGTLALTSTKDQTHLRFRASCEKKLVRVEQWRDVSYRQWRRGFWRSWTHGERAASWTERDSWCDLLFECRWGPQAVAERDILDGNSS